MRDGSRLGQLSRVAVPAAAGLLLAACAFVVASVLLPAPPAAADPAFPIPSRLAAPPPGFTDLQGDEPYAAAAEAIAAKAVMLRHYDGSFDPEGTVTRAEMAYFVTRLLGIEEAAGQPFLDVNVWDWFSGSVGALFQKGLILGSDSLTFSPQLTVTRQEAAAGVMNALAKAGGDQTVLAGGPQLTDDDMQRWLGGFRDRLLIAPEHLPFVAHAYRLGILDTPADGWFFPGDCLSRAEMAVMLQRAFLEPVAARTAYPEDLPAVAGYGPLGVGAKGSLVSLLESRLTALHYPCGPVDGVYDQRTRDGVMAFQKVERLKRTGKVNDQVWERLATAVTPAPARSGGGTRCEVDLARQVLFMITDGKVTKVVHVSTGKNGTRTGHFSIGSKYRGWVECVTVDGRMYFPSYVVSKTAIHGYPSVPSYPASHGCVRTPVWITEELYHELPTGTVVDIYHR